MSHNDRHVERSVRRHGGPEVEASGDGFVIAGTQQVVPPQAVARYAQTAAARIVQIDEQLEQLNAEKTALQARIATLTP